jgi:hypothetical protein
MKVREYVSEFGRFIDGYLAQHPEVKAEQRRGWTIWWDHVRDLDAERRAASDSVPTPGYYYH